MTSKSILLVGIIILLMSSCSVVDGLYSYTKVVEVRNPVTGRVWMDRNMGARRAANSITDSRAFGDLYQWGRWRDGHEDRSSSTTATTSSSDRPQHKNFIRSNDDPKDWRIPQNDSLWQGINGINNPCPSRFRLPTEEEWEEERQSWSSNDAEGAFDSVLKLPKAGVRRNSHNAFLSPSTVSGFYWSSTVSDQEARYLYFHESGSAMSSNPRAFSGSVRCIKN